MIMKKLVYLLPLMCFLLMVSPIEAKKKKYPNGDVYKGKWENGHPHGVGEMKYANGDIYYGDWFLGVKSGTGIMKYKNGDSFEGEWKYNKPTKGTMKYANGHTYIGELENGLMHGNGTMIQYGNVYTGEWKNGKQHGYGKTENIIGNNYEGEWENGMKHGKGTIFYENGDIYNGTWDRDEKSDYGELITLVNNRKLSYKGKWKDNTLYNGEIITKTILGDCIKKCYEGIESKTAQIKNSKWEYEGEIFDYTPFGKGIIRLKNNNELDVNIDEKRIEAIIIFSNNLKEIKILENKNSSIKNWIKYSAIEKWLDSISEEIVNKEKSFKLLNELRDIEIRAEHKEREKRNRERIAQENRISDMRRKFPQQIWYPYEIYNIYRDNPAKLQYFKSGYTILYGTIQEIERYTETDYNEYLQDFITTTMYRIYLQGGLILRVYEPHAAKLGKGQTVYFFSSYIDKVIAGYPVFNLNHILGYNQEAALEYILDLNENGKRDLHLRTKMP